MSSNRQNQRRRNPHPLWKPGNDKRSQNNASYPFSALDHRKTVPNPATGNETPVKTAIAIDLSKVIMETPMSPHTLALKFDQQEFPASDRLIAELEFNDNNSPIAAYTTVKRTRLPRTFKFGDKVIFSNIPQTPEDKKRKRITQIDSDNPALISGKIANIHRCFSECKIQSAIITKSSLQKSKKERAKNNNKRLTSQNENMAADGQSKHGSATQYAKSIYSATTSYDNLGAEDLKKITHHWCHLIAYFIEGDRTQDKDNLVAATVAANNMMTVIEQGIKEEVLNHNPTDGCKLTVKARLVEVANSSNKEHLQLATLIDMTVETKDFIITHTIDAQDKNNPHISCVKYHKALYNALRDKSEPNAKASARRVNSFFNAISTKRPTSEPAPDPKAAATHAKKIKPGF